MKFEEGDILMRKERGYENSHAQVISVYEAPMGQGSYELLWLETGFSSIYTASIVENNLEMAPRNTADPNFAFKHRRE